MLRVRIRIRWGRGNGHRIENSVPPHDHEARCFLGLSRRCHRLPRCRWRKIALCILVHNASRILRRWSSTSSAAENVASMSEERYDHRPSELGFATLSGREVRWRPKEQMSIVPVQSDMSNRSTNGRLYLRPASRYTLHPTTGHSPRRNGQCVPAHPCSRGFKMIAM